MTAFLSFLWEYKTIVAIALLAVVIAGQYVYIGVLKTQKSNLETSVENLNEKLKITKSSVDRLTTDIGTQNKMIAEFKAAAEKSVEENKPKIAAAETIASGLNKQADDILSTPQMKDTTACSAANELINSEIDNERK